MPHPEPLLLLASLLAIYFLLSIIIVHITRKDLPFLKTPLSKYAFGKNSFWLSSGFVLVGINEIIIAYVIRDNFPASLGLSLAGLGVTIVGLIKMDALNMQSSQNIIHNIGIILQFLSFPIAVGLLSLETFNFPLKIYYLGTSLATLWLFIIIFVLYPKYEMDRVKYYGLIQKTNILLMNICLIIIPLTL